MGKRVVSLVAPLVVGSMALVRGWFAHAALPTVAEAVVMEGRAA